MKREINNREFKKREKCKKYTRFDKLFVWYKRDKRNREEKMFDYFEKYQNTLN